MRILARNGLKLRGYRITHNAEKQPFADVLQNRSFRNFVIFTGKHLFFCYFSFHNILDRICITRNSHSLATVL